MIVSTEAEAGAAVGVGIGGRSLRVRTKGQGLAGMKKNCIKLVVRGWALRTTALGGDGMVSRREIYSSIEKTR